jgi:hypothetical protein
MMIGFEYFVVVGRILDLRNIRMFIKERRMIEKFSRP